MKKLMLFITGLLLIIGSLYASSYFLFHLHGWAGFPTFMTCIIFGIIGMTCVMKALDVN